MWWEGGKRDVDGGCRVVYIRIGITLGCVEVGVWEVY